jgi:hypothetical protein
MHGSSSAAGQYVSANEFIHPKLRNRLDPERVETLVHLYSSTRNVRGEDLEVCTQIGDVLHLLDLDEEDENDNHDADFLYN